MDLQTIHDASHELMCALNLKRGINPTYEEIVLDDKNPVPYQPLPLSETLLRFLPHDSALFHVVTTPSENQPNARWNKKFIKKADEELDLNPDEELESESDNKPIGTTQSKAPPKNGVHKPNSKKKGNTKNLATGAKAQLRAQTQKIGPWSQFFKKAPGIEKVQHETWKHVLRPTQVRHQEARERKLKLELTNEEKAAGTPIPEPEFWAPKRPMNNFMLYRMTFQEFAKKHYGSAHHNKISVMTAFSWALEPKEVKATFAAMAIFDHWCMLEACPRYRFTPRKPKTTKLNPTKQTKKEPSEGTKGKASQPATLIRRNLCWPGTNMSSYQPLYRTPSGHFNGSRQPVNTNSINYTYWKAPEYTIKRRIGQHSAMDNFYYQSGTLPSNFAASSLNFNHYQLPLDNLLNDFVMMDIKPNPSASNVNGASSLNQLSLGNLGGTYPSGHGPFPMIAQQPDGLTIGGGSTRVEDYAMMDEFRFDDYVYMS